MQNKIMKKKIMLCLLFSCFFLFLASCSANKNNGEIQNLSPQETAGLLAQKEENGLFVLNVHTPYAGEIEKTDAIIEDWQNIAAHVNQLPEDKNTPILVYCRSGRMSSSAVQQLQALGYTNISHLDGGMLAWQEQGFSIINASIKLFEE